MAGALTCDICDEPGGDLIVIDATSETERAVVCEVCMKRQFEQFFSEQRPH